MVFTLTMNIRLSKMADPIHLQLASFKCPFTAFGGSLNV